MFEPSIVEIIWGAAAGWSVGWLTGQIWIRINRKK